MNQEENRENKIRNEDAADLKEENAPAEEAAANASEEIDNVPVESIGSYARVEELLTDEEAENTTRRDSES